MTTYQAIPSTPRAAEQPAAGNGLPSGTPALRAGPPHASMPSCSSTPASPHSQLATPHSPPSPLQLFLLHKGNPNALLAAGLPLDQVLAFADDPVAQHKLKAFTKLTLDNLAIRAAEARQTAINTLEELAKSSQDPVERRRASTFLLRATSAPLVHAGAIPERPTKTAIQPTQPLDVLPAALPAATLTPDDVKAVIVHAITNPDKPEPNRGLATIAAFIDDRAILQHQAIEALAPLPDTSEATSAPTPADAPSAPLLNASTPGSLPNAATPHDSPAHASMRHAPMPLTSLPSSSSTPLPSTPPRAAPSRRPLTPLLRDALKALFENLSTATSNWSHRPARINESEATLTIGFGCRAGPHQLLLKLTRRPDSAFPNCWLISGLETERIYNNTS